MRIGPFSHDILPVTVVFGCGERAHLADHLERLAPQRVLVIHGGTGKELAAQLGERLGNRLAGTFTELVQHVPADLAEQAVSRANEAGVDTVVAIGGGSAIGYAKAVARATGARIAAVPTTYSGSEMSPIWGLTADGRKSTGRDPAAMPRLVLYDPELTLRLPPATSAASGLNAVAHAVDGLYAAASPPTIAMIAVRAIEMLAVALPAIVNDPGDLEAREHAMYAAHLAGTVAGTVPMALHHRICHVLGGTYGLAHAETHAVILPHAIAFNGHAAPQATHEIAQALGGADAAVELWELNRRLGLPAGLGQLGMRENDLDGAAAAVAAMPVPNPAAVTVEGVRRLLGDAFAGQSPRR